MVMSDDGVLDVGGNFQVVPLKCVWTTLMFSSKQESMVFLMIPMLGLVSQVLDQ